LIYFEPGKESRCIIVNRQACVYEGVDSNDWNIDVVSKPLLAVFHPMPWEYKMCIEQVATAASSSSSASSRTQRTIDFVPFDGKYDTCCLDIVKIDGWRSGWM